MLMNAQVVIRYLLTGIFWTNPLETTRKILETTRKIFIKMVLFPKTSKFPLILKSCNVHVIETIVK